MRGTKRMVVWVCALALGAPQTLVAGQSFAAESGTAAARSVSGPAASLEGETVVVHGKRLQAPPLPHWLNEELNAPLAPAPTALEKKIGPAVQTARYLWFIGTLIAVLATGSLAKNK
jgi:hypothetical protein